MPEGFNHIKNKDRRLQMYHKRKAQETLEKREQRKKKKREEQLLLAAGEALPEKQVPRTLDNTREFDDTMVEQDEEVAKDEDMDEFSSFFSNGKPPKIVITSGYRASKRLYTFMRELLYVFPNSSYYARKKYEIKKIVKAAIEREFTDVLIVNEDKKNDINGLTVIHLPDGPTAYFKLTNPILHSELPKAGKFTTHKPEVVLNNFNTRLGHRVGRMLGSLFHQEPNFHGRRVVTFHNQRDFIFFRHHRYIFDSIEKARIQELGPQFTLKLEWLQRGTFDTKHGEYEWKHKSELDTSRRRFFL